jgi:hypothetical protein
VRQIRWRWVQDSTPASARVQALGCSVGCMGSACPRRSGPARPSRSCPPLAVSAVSGLAKRPRSGLALTRRTPAEIIVQRGGRAPARKAATTPRRAST